MPVWRPRGAWLREAVESALGQAECDLELVVVDDGNPSPVEPLVAGIEDARLRVHRVEHGGAYAARNAGVARSRGRWVRFLDADDVAEKGSTARLLHLAQTGDDVIAYGSTVVCDEELRPEWEIASDLEGSVHEACVAAEFDVRVVSMLFPRRILALAGEWDPTFAISGDWEYVLRALEHGRVLGERAPATYYRRHPSSLTMAADVAAGEEAWRRIIDGYLQRHPEQRGTELERRARRALLLDRADAYAHVGERRRALRRLAAAARLDPRASAALTLRLLRGAAAGLLRRGG
jgi:glycosyltransferase involved in cell wall biosynthesis